MNSQVVRIAILSSLVAGHQHGYGILHDISQLSEGRLTPQVGSLYRVIDLLVRDGFVEEHSTEVVDGRFRRYYRLTPSGRSELLETTATMAAVVAHTRRWIAYPCDSAETAPIDGTAI